MLGKLDVVFHYSSHFFLSTWPENRPGYMFLTDADGLLLNKVPLQTGQIWRPAYFRQQRGEVLSTGIVQMVRSACESGQISSRLIYHDGQTDVCSVLPYKGDGQQVIAVMGLLVPQRELDIDLASYLRGLEPLILMGIDAIMKRTISEIVMEASQYSCSSDMLYTVVQEVAQVIGKGHCAAIKLDKHGSMMRGEWLTTETPSAEGNQLELDTLLSEYANWPVTPLVTDQNRKVFVPIYCEGEPLYTLLLYLPKRAQNETYNQRDISFLQTIGDKIRHVLYQTITSEQIRQDATRKELVHEMTKKIQASIDVNEVLEAIVRSMHLLYPEFVVELYLTVDTNTVLPVKQLSIQLEKDTYSSQAYLQGKLVIGNKRQDDGKQVTVIATPLLGKQGIYGVLELTANALIDLSPQESQAISTLAEAAGTAFENAQLYHHSRSLNRELRLINEMSQQLNRTLDVGEIYDFVIEVLLEIFEAEYSAILHREDHPGILTVEAASDPKDRGREVPIAGPLATILEEKQPVIVAGDQTGKLAGFLPSCSSFMGVPLHREEEVIGIILVSDSRQHHFRLDDLKLLEIFAQHTSLASANAILHTEMEQMVITDHLTRLNTRPFLDEHVKKSLAQDCCGSLILIDIDYFKRINDTFGHQVGDSVLVQTATLIKQSIRDVDVAARWGGEEIAVYLPNADKNAAISVAERIRRCVEEKTEPPVTISVGIASWTQPSEVDFSVEVLFHNADTALYKAKSRGRNQVIVM